jgi:hypothetical protein
MASLLLLVSAGANMRLYLDNCCFNRPFDNQSIVRNRLETEAVLRKEGMEALLDKLGRVDAERFITSIIREPFDYTEWQSQLFKDLSVEELSAKAQAYYERTDN